MVLIPSASERFDQDNGCYQLPSAQLCDGALGRKSGILSGRHFKVRHQTCAVAIAGNFQLPACTFNAAVSCSFDWRAGSEPPSCFNQNQPALLSLNVNYSHRGIKNSPNRVTLLDLQKLPALFGEDGT